MKRTLRRAALTASAVAFLAFLLGWLAALLLSVIDDRPRWVEPYLAWRTGPTRVYVAAVTRGGLSLERRELPWAPATWPPARSMYDPDPTSAVQTVETLSVQFSMGRFDDVSVLGFEAGHWDAHIGFAGKGGPTRGVYVAVPIWFLLLATGLFPGRAAARALRVRWRRAGLCKTCGYDLRASPDRCPECGTPRRASLLTRVGGWLRRPAPSARAAGLRPGLA